MKSIQDDSIQIQKNEYDFDYKIVNVLRTKNLRDSLSSTCRDDIELRVLVNILKDGKEQKLSLLIATLSGPMSYEWVDFLGFHFDNIGYEGRYNFMTQVGSISATPLIRTN